MHIDQRRRIGTLSLAEPKAESAFLANSVFLFCLLSFPLTPFGPCIFYTLCPTTICSTW